MQGQLRKYQHKLEAQGLARTDGAFLMALDADICSAGAPPAEAEELRRLFDQMSINALLFAEPAEPYRTIIAELCGDSGHLLSRRTTCGGLERIVPEDCETRTFFHDIPVIHAFTAEDISSALSQRKSVIIRDRGIVSHGRVTPEQAFVSFSSACFSTFVCYFAKGLSHLESAVAGGARPDKSFIRQFSRVWEVMQVSRSAGETASLLPGPPVDEDHVISMICEAGRAVVDRRLVDSYFGNISYLYDGSIFISQTGSSMDELGGCIDAVPLDGSSSVGITASSELSAHRNIYAETQCRAILHGHPKFAVIMSMVSSPDVCTIAPGAMMRDRIAGIPVVSGDIGTGPSGLMHTVPAAMREGRGAIVYGHGVFTAGAQDFREPFERLCAIEQTCRDEYGRRVRAALEALSR